MPAPPRSRPGDASPGPDPAPLGAPFGVGDLAWTIVEVADARDEVRVVARPSPEALYARLDAVVGLRGWSVRYEPMPGDAVACHLELEGVVKGFVAPAALTGGGSETAAVALAGAAALWGARTPWPPGASAWVACDPETLVPLEVPAVPAPASRRAGVAWGSAQAPGAAAAAADDVATGPESEVDRGGADGADAATPAPTERPAGTPGPVAEAGTPAAKPETQQLIDRLIDRLKAQGQGLAAARVLVRHGGYGSNPQAARELYAELRALLLAGTAAEATP